MPRDLRLELIVQRTPQRKLQRRRPDTRTTPRNELAIAMLAQHIRIDAVRRDSGSRGQGAAQACRVERRAGAEDLGLGEPGELPREVGQDVNGVGDEEEDGVRGDGGHGTEYGGEDVEVAGEEGEPRFTCRLSVLDSPAACE